MIRPAHGATTRPLLSRPGSGFGRPTRPGPAAGWRERWSDPERGRCDDVFDELLVLGRLEFEKFDKSNKVDSSDQPAPVRHTAA